MVTERCNFSESSSRYHLQSPQIPAKPSTSYFISPCENNVPDRPDPTPGYDSRRTKSSTDLHKIQHFDPSDTALRSGDSNLDILVESNFDYQPQDSDELKLKPGSTIRLLRRDEQNDDGWWFGEAEDGRKGFFPQNYVKLKSGRPREICMKDLEFTGILGTGGFCVVKSAVYKGKEVAVKIPHAKFRPEELLKTVREEAGIFRQLSHKNILKMYGVIAGPEPALVLELCKDSLANLCSKSRNLLLPNEILYNWGAQIAHGMSYLHGLNILHRDLKAANILVKEKVCECLMKSSASDSDLFDREFQSFEGVCSRCEGAALSRLTLKIADLGLCKKMQFRSVDCRMSVVGTLPYLPPEVVREQKCSKAMDIWSFGLVLWEMLTGLTPFEGVDRGYVELQIGRFQKQSIPENCPEDLRNIIEDCWVVEPDKRPTFAQLVRQFETFLEANRASDLQDKQLGNCVELLNRERMVENMLRYNKMMFEELSAREKKLSEEEMELQMRKIAFAYQTEPKVKPQPPKGKKKPKPSDISEPRDFVQKVSLTPKNVLKSTSRDDSISATTPDRPKPGFDWRNEKNEQLKDKEIPVFGFATLPRTPKKLAAKPQFEFPLSPPEVTQQMPSRSTPDLPHLYSLSNTITKDVESEENSPKLHRANAKRLKKDSGRSSTDCKEAVDGSCIEISVESVTDLEQAERENRAKALEHLATPKRTSQSRSSSVSDPSKTSSGKKFFKKLFAKKDKSPVSGTESPKMKSPMPFVPSHRLLGNISGLSANPYLKSAGDLPSAKPSKRQKRKKTKAGDAEEDGGVFRLTKNSETFVKTSGRRQSTSSTTLTSTTSVRPNKSPVLQRPIEGSDPHVLEKLCGTAGKSFENFSYVPPSAMNAKTTSAAVSHYTTMSASQSPSSSSTSWDELVPCQTFIVPNPSYNPISKVKKGLNSPDSPIMLDTDVTGGLENDDGEICENTFSNSRGSEPGISYENLPTKLANMRLSSSERPYSSECELYVSLNDLQRNRLNASPRRDGTQTGHNFHRTDRILSSPRKDPPPSKQYINMSSKPSLPSSAISSTRPQRPLTLNLRQPSTPAESGIATAGSSYQSFPSSDNLTPPPSELAPRPAPPIPPRAVPRRSEEDIAGRQKLSPVSQSPS